MSWLILADVSLQRLQEESDRELRRLKELVGLGWPRTSKSEKLRFHPYWGVYNNMSIVDGPLMAGSHIIIPSL